MATGDGAAISNLISELDSLNQFPSPSTALSEEFLLSLLTILDSGEGAALWHHLAANELPLSALLRPLSLAMDSSDPPSLLPAAAYLSLLLLPSAPVHSLFSPLQFLSLLRSLRLSSKTLPSNPPNPRKRRPQPLLGSDAGDLLIRVLEALGRVLDLVHLESSPETLKSLVETTTNLLANPSLHHRIPQLCSRILFALISRPQHGDQTISSVEVLKSLASIILSSGKSPAKASALAFVTRQVLPLARESDKIHKALVYFPRFLAAKAPEKAEPRALAVDSIVEVVRAMEVEDQIAFVDYVVRMLQGKSQLRMMAVDLSLALLTSLPDPLGTKDSEVMIEDWWGVRCLQALLLRCSDSMAFIRARALTNTAQVIESLSADEGNCVRLQEVMGLGSSVFNELLKRRCVDEKAAVRKAALVLITKSTSFIGKPVDEAVLKTVGLACSDPLVSIRKAALMAISEVYRRFPEGNVSSEWLHSIPRLIMDNETSIQEECENLFLELVLDKVARLLKVSLSSDAEDLESLFPKGVLDLLKGICEAEVVPCVRKICTSLGKKGKLKTTLTNALQNIITISETLWLRSSMPIEKWTAPRGAWQLLSEVSLFTPKAVEWRFLHHHWQLLDEDGPKAKGQTFDGMEENYLSWSGDRVALLQTISNVSIELPSEPAAELAHNFLRRIEDFSMHLSEVDAHVKALNTLCKRKAANAVEGNSLIVKWVHQLLSKALKILDNYVSEVSKASKAGSFLTPPQSGRKRGKKEALTSDSMTQAVTAVFTVGSVIMICPSADLKGISPLLHSIITSGRSERKPKKLAGLIIPVKEMAPSLYIQSWVTMGKICLVDGKLAKRYIPLFVQELERSESAALRNNIMVMMADFCVRYTALVDCYIPKITASLRDPCEVVRRQTFVLLSRLLQRDYVKWRGVLFLRFLLSLVDDSEKIRHLANYLFGNILKVKAPLLAYNSFVEAIFVLNDCHAHARHSETPGDLHTGPLLFSIRGNDEKSRSQRMHIYVSLLKQMAPEHLLATSAKLCAEILAAASDGLLNIDDVAGRSVLQDALEVLACKEMRLHSSRGSETTEVDDEGGDGGTGGGALLAARGRVVTQVAKKSLVQTAIPIFIELKRLLESKNSPLTGCLMDCLCVLLKDYRNEIDEILIADKQLQKELIYDMKKYEAAKGKSKVAEAVPARQSFESYISPRNQTTNKGKSPMISEKLDSGKNVALAVAHAGEKAKARSVLKDLNCNVPTPPLHSMSLPKLKSTLGNTRPLRSDHSSDILESVRRRHSFEADDEK